MYKLIKHNLNVKSENINKNNPAGDEPGYYEQGFPKWSEQMENVTTLVVIVDFD